MRLLKEIGHRRWRRDLSAYVDGHLEPPRHEALERHLATCARCQEEITALRRVVALLGRVPQVEAPRSFALAQAPSASRRWPALLYGSSLRYATAAAAMLLLAVVVGDLATVSTTAIVPTEPGIAETQSEEGPQELTDTSAAAPDAPQAGGQSLTTSTPAPPPMPSAASEKSQETVDAGEPPFTTPSGSVILHNWFRWGELALGAVLAVLITVVSIQWWQGRRRRQV